MTRLDPHSYYDTTQPRTKHMQLAWRIDFAQAQIDGAVTLTLESPASGPMDLDTKGLLIRSAETSDGASVPFTLEDEQPILGRRLRLSLPSQTSAVTIRYATSPDATALQWFEPSMTLGKQHPFMYSQCQSIHARTIVPCQDTPRVRVSYSAAITVPEPLTAVMSAGPSGSQSQAPGTRTFLFEMPQPIPTYLLAIAAGDLTARRLGPRSHVWAEPGMVERAAYELVEIEQMIQRAEALFGPYDWESYDLLVLPPAFPYGGMENPRMTFLTPTIIAGDRSMVDVMAHELAHSWTGNLVTNASMEHFWLNEGATTWAERRILEAIHGTDDAALKWAIGQKALDESLERFGEGSPFTRLRTEMQGVDPDDTYSSIPYEKGARFFVLLEQHVGRQRFDAFMIRYMKRFRFTSITTEEFLEFFRAELPGVSEAVGVDVWLYQPGMPANAPVFHSAKLDSLVALAQNWERGERPAQAMSPTELLVYLQHLPRELEHSALSWLEEVLQLSARRNYDVLVEWLVIAGGSDYEPVFSRIKQVLLEVGRMKYLRPLYKALMKHPRTQRLANEIYDQGRSGYHSLSRRVIESELGRASS